MGNYNKKNKEYWNKRHRINNNGISERLCSSCNTWKEENIENFYLKNKNKPEIGYTGECILCIRERSNNYYINNLDKEKERSQRPDVKEMRNNIHKKWRKENKEFWSEYFSSYLKRDSVKEKFKLYNQNKRKHDVSDKEWKNCLKTFDYSCAYCGLNMQDHYRTYAGKLQKISLHKEHVDPNGKNDLSNCVPSCRFCNDYKWTFMLNEWYCEDNPVYDKNKYNKIIWWINEGYMKYIEVKI